MRLNNVGLHIGLHQIIDSAEILTEEVFDHGSNPYLVLHSPIYTILFAINVHLLDSIKESLDSCSLCNFSCFKKFWTSTVYQELRKLNLSIIWMFSYLCGKINCVFCWANMIPKYTKLAMYSKVFGQTATYFCFLWWDYTE